MADLDETGLTVVKVGDRVRLVDGKRGTVRDISESGENFSFDRYQIELTSGEILTEPRYRFDVIPSCPGRDVGETPVTLELPTSEQSLSCRPINTDIEETVVLDEVHNSPHPECDNAESSDDSLADFDIDGFINNEANKNTKKKTTSDVNTVHKYFQTKLKEKRPIESIPPSHLNKLLCIFFMNVRNQKGAEYEPSSIRGIQCSLDRYLKMKDYGKQIATSADFAKVMDVIRCKQKKTKKRREGKSTKKS